MDHYGLIGYPLHHSFSKDFFEKKFERENRVDAVFHNFPIQQVDELEDVLEQHPHLKGLAVTIPHKKAIVDFLFDYDDVVKSIHACNCIKIKGNILTGYNTDVIGFEKSLVNKLQPYMNAALILGTGGAAAAAAFVLEKLGFRYFFVSRQKVANCIAYTEITKKIIDDFPVIINCTPVGMFPNSDAFPPLPYEFLSERNYLFDMVYNPAMTRFLEKGNEKGAITQNGYEMLVIQAEENWRIWNS